MNIIPAKCTSTCHITHMAHSCNTAYMQVTALTLMRLLLLPEKPKCPYNMLSVGELCSALNLACTKKYCCSIFATDLTALTWSICNKRKGEACETRYLSCPQYQLQLDGILPIIFLSKVESSATNQSCCVASFQQDSFVLCCFLHKVAVIPESHLKDQKISVID